MGPATARRQKKTPPCQAGHVRQRGFVSVRPWRHLSGASWKFKGFDVPAGRLRPLTSPASERRAAQGWRPGVTPRHRKEQPGVKAAPGPGIVGGIPEAAAGGFPYSPFLENFGPRTLVAVRPLLATSRHSMGYAKESALTPKAEFRGPMSAFPPISSALHLGADVLVTCPRLPVMTLSGHSLDRVSTPFTNHHKRRPKQRMGVVRFFFIVHQRQHRPA